MAELVIGLDFDGTCAEHRFPDIGPEVPGAIMWVKKWIEAGAKVVLNTMRSDRDDCGPALSDAVKWLESRGVKLYGVNRNPDQDEWTESPKVYAQIYVDDAAFGCPLRPGIRCGRPMADWDRIGPPVLQIIEQHFARRRAG